MVSMEGLRALVAQRGAPRVSIYLPLHLAGPETKKDTIRLGNLITRAEEILEAQSANGEGGRTRSRPASTTRSRISPIERMGAWPNDCSSRREIC